MGPETDDEDGRDCDDDGVRSEYTRDGSSGDREGDLVECLYRWDSNHSFRNPKVTKPKPNYNLPIK